MAGMLKQFFVIFSLHLPGGLAQLTLPADVELTLFSPMVLREFVQIN